MTCASVRGVLCIAGNDAVLVPYPVDHPLTKQLKSLCAEHGKVHMTKIRIWAQIHG